MVDPFSITTGVLALLRTCIKVASAIKEFRDGVAIVDTKVEGLLSDVESFSQVLDMMKDTLEEDKVKSTLQATGHIGNHWTNLSKSIKDGHNTLLYLQSTLTRINKSVGVLNGARKQLRLKESMDEITMFQQQIRSYRDTIHLSLQTVILWNQVTFNESNDKILPSLDEIHNSIWRIAFDINARMITLQTLVESTAKKEQMESLSNLRNCVESAASVVSSASTTLGIEQQDQFSVAYGSEFGDCFPSQPSETMLRWVSSNTIYEFEENVSQAGISQTGSRPNGKATQQDSEISDPDQSDHSDSDNELEVAKVQALLRQGKQRLNAEDFAAAERAFRNCLTRSTNSLSRSSVHSSLRPEIMEFLISTYMFQDKWSEIQSILLEKIALDSRNTSMDNSTVLPDIMLLAHALLNQSAYAEALLYARRAHKGYRRMGHSGIKGMTSALELLVEISHEEGNIDEEEAYTAMLSDLSSALPTTSREGQMMRLSPPKKTESRATFISTASSPSSPPDPAADIPFDVSLHDYSSEEISMNDRSLVIKPLGPSLLDLPTEPQRAHHDDESSPTGAVGYGMSKDSAEQVVALDHNRNVPIDEPFDESFWDFVFRWEHPANEVFVTGTFDDWSKKEKLVNVGGIFEKRVTLSAASKIYYKFVVDGTWVIDHTAPQEIDSLGNSNNVLTTDRIHNDRIHKGNIKTMAVGFDNAQTTVVAIEEKCQNHRISTVLPGQEEEEEAEETADVSTGGKATGEDFFRDPHPAHSFIKPLGSIASVVSGAEILRKITIVGDVNSGKTCLLILFCKGVFPVFSEETVFENCWIDVKLDGKNVGLALWDSTSGDEFRDRLRALSYPDSDVIMICFAIDEPWSLENVQSKWHFEAFKHCPGKPIVLVGTKKDLRDDPSTLEKLQKTRQKPVTWKEGEAVRRMIGACRYLECSAKTGEGVREVFEHATIAAVLRRRKKKKKSLWSLFGKSSK